MQATVVAALSQTCTDFDEDSAGVISSVDAMQHVLGRIRIESPKLRNGSHAAALDADGRRSASPERRYMNRASEGAEGLGLNGEPVTSELGFLGHKGAGLLARRSSSSNMAWMPSVSASIAGRRVQPLERTGGSAVGGMGDGGSIADSHGATPVEFRYYRPPIWVEVLAVPAAHQAVAGASCTYSVQSS